MKNTLVFGTSLKTDRYSNIAVRRLQEKGENTFAFGQLSGSIGHVQVKNKLNKLPKIDIVTMYLGPARQKEYYNAIIALKPEKVIFNPGTENEEFYTILKAHNIEVEVACTLVLLATGQY